MRKHLLALIALAATGVSLMSCGDDGDEPNSQDQTTAPGPAVGTMPIDDIADKIVEMPDGIQLRPGVDIWEMAPPVQPYILIDPHSTVVTVLPPAFEAFEPVGFNDVVFVNDVSFIVEKVDRHADEWLIHVSPVDLSRIVWGNFSIPWEADTRVLGDSPDDLMGDEPPVYDEFGNMVRGQAETPFDLVNRSIYADFAYGRGHVVFDATLRIPATMRGKFEGRIGTFNKSYRCADPSDGSFCVDYMSAYASTTVDLNVKNLTASFTASATASKDKTVFDKTIATVNLGTTGLKVIVNAYLKITAEAKATGAVTAETAYQFNRTVPFGFEYINKPNQQGVYAIYNERYPISGAGGSFSKQNFKLDAGVDFSVAAELGVDFGLGTLGGLAKIRGAKVAVVLEGALSYHPLQLAVNPGECASADVSLYGKAEADLTFEVDLKLWSWKENISCPGQGSCATLTTRPMKLVEKEFAGTCLDQGFDTLVIEPVSTTSPPGFDDVPGYDVDSVCVTHVTPANRRAGLPSRSTTFCATSGPAGLRGRADGTCPMSSAQVAGLSGPTEIKFGRDIQPGDVIVVTHSNNAAACQGSGKAKLTLKKGSRTRPLGDGAAFEQNISVTYE